MKSHRLIRLTSTLLVLAGGIGSMAVAEDEPLRLRDKAVLNTLDIVSNDYAAFSPDGKTLLTFGVGDGKVLLWDMASEKNSVVLRHRRSNAVNAAAFSPDGKSIATAGYDGEIWIWDAKNGKKITSFAGHKEITALTYNGGGNTLSAAGRGELRVYDVAQESPALNGRLLRVRAIDPRKSFNSLRPVGVSRAMKRTMMGCGTQLYDAVTGNVCYRLTENEARSGTFPSTVITVDERKAATVGRECIVIWDLKAKDQDQGRPKHISHKQPDVAFHCLALSPNDKILAAGYEYETRRPGIGVGRGGILFVDVASGKLLLNHDARIGAVNTLAFSPDGRLLATADRDGVIKLWEVPVAWRKSDK